MTRPQPIRIGDRFADKQGTEWRVVDTRPAGRVDLFDKKHSRFVTYYVHQIRAGSFTRLATES